jgi:hypothetical protein
MREANDNFRAPQNQHSGNPDDKKQFTLITDS